MKLLVFAAPFLTLCLAPGALIAQTARNVAVVINESDPASIRIGEYYVQQRDIPSSNVIRIETSTAETIDRETYTTTIQNPIAAALAREQLQDRILYLVLTKGVPLRVAGTGGQEGTGASVDSELTLLYRRMVGETVLLRGRVDNPYYLGASDLSDARPFSHRAHDIYLVSRIDAFTVDEAMALIDRATAPSTEGHIVLDQMGGLTNRLGDEWLAEASKRLTDAGHGDRVILEPTGKPVRDVAPVLGYYSWGSTDPQNRVRRFGMTFAPGAIAATFVSTDARTFREPPAAWTPTGVVTTRASLFGGTAHSLIGDLIREGVTGVAGHVGEPYLQSVVRPEVLFAAYLAGHNLIEAFYLALPHLGWQAVVIGDPLCTPFPRRGLEQTDLDPSIDATTELPGFFSERRVRTMAASAPGMPERAVRSWVRATALLTRDDKKAAMTALEEVTELAPKEVSPRITLAMLHDEDGEVERAMQQYRQVLEIQPNNVVALNNLAYALAVHRGVPAEALPLARRAVSLAPNLASVLDTLAWVEHLMGDHVTAARRLEEAIKRDPRHPDFRVHAATVYAALGSRERARVHLQEAVRLRPSLEETDEVKKLKRQLEQ
jgi:uncharacterized protein (TIGR03790 family)